VRWPSSRRPASLACDRLEAIEISEATPAEMLASFVIE
jgi:hypothetical protein